MSPLASWLLIAALGIGILVVTFYLDSLAWRTRDHRAERRYRRELAALRRMTQDKETQ